MIYQTKPKKKWIKYVTCFPAYKYNKNQMRMMSCEKLPNGKIVDNSTDAEWSNKLFQMVFQWNVLKNACKIYSNDHKIYAWKKSYYIHTTYSKNNALSSVHQFVLLLKKNSSNEICDLIIWMIFPIKNCIEVVAMNRTWRPKRWRNIHIFMNIISQKSLIFALL